MVKNKNKVNRKNGQAAESAIALFPSWNNPENALDWWRRKISNGFSPEALSAALDALDSGDVSIRTHSSSSQSLPAHGSPLPGYDCPDWTPVAAFMDSANDRLFFAGAAHEGLGCFEAASGKTIWSLPPGTLGRAGGMALGPAGLYVCDRWRHRVLVLDPDNGKERAGDRPVRGGATAG